MFKKAKVIVNVWYVKGIKMLQDFIDLTKPNFLKRLN